RLQRLTRHLLDGPRQLVGARWYRRDTDCDVRGLGQGGLLQLLPARRQSAGVATVHAVVPRDVGRPRELRVRRRDVTMVTRAQDVDAAQGEVPVLTGPRIVLLRVVDE